MMTKIPEVLKSGSGKRWVWITGVVAIFALLFAIAWNIECERAVAPQELPGEARSFIAQHYPEENPVLVIKTLDELAVTYKVVFADGTQVKFRRNGMWREIKSRSRAVPSRLLFRRRLRITSLGTFREPSSSESSILAGNGK